MANTLNVTLETNFNTAPYYDDFDETKNYHRILYRPGLAPQAREWIQQQTMLQNQIDRFASHVFKEGSLVKGGEFIYEFDIPYVKVNDTNASGNTIILSNYQDMELTGDTSGVTAVVRHSANGTQAEDPNTKTLYVRFTSSGTSNNEQKVFTDGENLTSNNGFTATVFSSNTAQGFASIFTLGEAIVYAKDHFIRAEEQTIILGRYSTVPSVHVGYMVDETIITPNDDSTLNDIALGEPNYAAPGAHRLKLTPNLTKYATGNTIPSGFIELFQVKDGVLQHKFDRPQYADLMNELARRMYNESGDYVVRGLTVRTRDHLDDGTNDGYLTSANGGNTYKLAVGVEPGIGLVKGFEYENLITRWLPIDKGIDYKDVDEVSIPANYGNFVNVDEVAGAWNINEGATIWLMDDAQNAVSNLSYSTTAPVGNTIGTAKLRTLEHNTGNPGDPGAAYKLYLYDIQMTGNSFSIVKGFYSNNTTNADGFADTVLSSNGIAVLNETAFNRAIYDIPANYIRSIRDSGGSVDTTYKFIKDFDVTVATDGTFSIATGAGDEQFPFSTGALNASQKDENFTVALNGGQTVTLTGLATFTSGSNNVTGSSTTFNTELIAGDKVTANSETFRISSVTNGTHLVLASQPSSTSTTIPVKKQFLAGEIIDMGATGSNGTSRSVTINSTTSASFETGENFDATVSATVRTNLNKTTAQEKRKLLRDRRYVKIDCSSHSANVVGPWSIGVPDVFSLRQVRQHTSTFSANTDGTDVTSDFELDDGQRDNFYDLARVKKKSSSSLTIGATDHLLFYFDYFEHDFSQGVGYMSVDSYPIDDDMPSNTTAITTEEITRYTSPVTGAAHRLRDSIDSRPVISLTATDSTSVGGASTNPSADNTFNTPAGGLHTPVPNEDFVIDFSYYLPRKDLVIIDQNGAYNVIRGISSRFPRTPKVPDNAMALAAIDITPFPSLPPKEAQRLSRDDLAIKVRQLTNRRFTMRDIGAINQRVHNLEYYTSLSLLEKDTADMKIQDSAGLDRFKNGILVDPFTGHRVGDVYNVDYRASIDPKNKELRPRFSLQNAKLEYSPNSVNIYRAAKDATLTVTDISGFSNGETVFQGADLGSASAQGTLTYGIGSRLYVEQTTGTFSDTIVVKGASSGVNTDVTTVAIPADKDLCTLPYTHEQYLNQPYASTTRNAAGLQWHWKGYLVLDPPNDFWTDTVELPELRVNFDNNYDNWLVVAQNWESQWNSWETEWTSSSVLDETTDVQVTTQGNDIVETTTTTTTTLTEERLTRTGIGTTITEQLQNHDLGDRVIDVSLQPYMRARNITFTAYGLKPNTRVYPFFDGDAVTAYCAPLTFTLTSGIVTPTQDENDLTSSDFGTALTTDSNGNLAGLFALPNTDAKKFSTGNKIFRLTDSITNQNQIGLLTTAAEEEYAAQGVSQSRQATILATRNALLGQGNIVETVENESISTSTQVGTRIVGTIDPPDDDNPFPVGTVAWDNGDSAGGDEPLSQSFMIRQDGDNHEAVFATKVDLFFQSKHATLPVIVEIRAMGAAREIVSENVLPFSRVIMYPDQVNVSEDGTIPTPVRFESPVALQRGKDYVIWIRPAANNPDYRVWLSKLGDSDISTGERVSEQPFIGMLFASANDKTWSPLQDEDLKFTLHVANFDTTVSGTLYLDNQETEYLSVSNASARFTTVGEPIHGEVRLTTSNLSGSANVGEKIVGTTTSANGIITTVDGNTFHLRDVGIGSDNKFSVPEDVTFYFANGETTGASANVGTLSTPVGLMEYYNNNEVANTILYLKSANGNFVNAEQITGQYDGSRAYINRHLQLQLNTLHPQIGEITFPATSIAWTTKVTSNASHILSTSWETVDANKNNDFDDEKAVLSGTIEATDISGESSLQLRGIFNTSNRRMSPVVDLSRVGSILIGNQLNNDNTGEDGASGGNAKARYMTRRVILAEGQDAEDLKVFITAYRPAGSTIEVYAKLWNSEDSDLFDDISWTKLTNTDSALAASDTENKQDFKEFEYSLPTASMTGDNGEFEYMNSQGVTFTGYKIFAIKIVLLSTNTSVVPRLKDLRSIALQI